MHALAIIALCIFLAPYFFQALDATVMAVPAMFGALGCTALGFAWFDGWWELYVVKLPVGSQHAAMTWVVVGTVAVGFIGTVVVRRLSKIPE